MEENELKKLLEKYNLNSKQISEFVEYFYTAKATNIPYPFYYAISKVIV
jgi:hypothetical protein